MARTIPQHEPARTIYMLLAEPLGRADADASHEAAPYPELLKRFHGDVVRVLGGAALVGRLPRALTVEEVAAADIHASGCFDHHVEMALALAAKL